MSRRLVIVFTTIVVIGFLIVGGAAVYVLRTPAAQVGQITAIPLATNTEVVQPTDQSASLNVSEGTILGEVVQEQSEARFIIDEVLNGNPNTVIGVTNQVAAQLAIDPNNPANVQLGVVQVDVRSLVTDNSMRNRAIQNFVLQSNKFEFVTFKPTQFIGLPESGKIGDTFSFQIVGDLTIKDVTKSVTFDVTITLDSDQQLSGLATTTISRQDFHISIPQVRQVASVDDDLRLELQFVAMPVNG